MLKMVNLSFVRFFITVILIALQMKEYSTNSSAEAMVSIKDFRQTECMDLKPTKFCERRKAKGDCQRLPELAKQYCQLTCDLCTTGTTTEPANTDCRDKLPATKCEKMKNRGKCERYPNWAEKKCRLTCGLCTLYSTTDSSSVTTVTPLTTTSIDPNGTGGVPPPIKHYLGVWGERGTNGVPGDAHAVHGLVTKDGTGYIVCGKGDEQGEEKRGSSIDGFVLRINPCPQQSDYAEHYLGVQLLKPGNDCRSNYKWVTRIGSIDRYDFTNWVAESPDGAYIIAVGATNVGVGNHHIARVVTKLDSFTGEIVWSATLPINDNLGEFKSSAYESIVFTSDGGFIASGFTNNPFEGSATEGPMFKSAGQVEEGNPMIEKFPYSVASANEINAADLVIGKNIEWRYKNDEATGTEMGSAKALRAFMDKDIEMVVGVYGTRAAVVVLNVQDGSVFKQQILDESLGQISDVEVITDIDTNFVQGFSIVGHSYNEVHSGTDGCTSTCTDIRGQIYILNNDLILVKSNFWDGFKGGLYQYSGITEGYGTLINTECWGIAKSYDQSGEHDGFVVGCGNGIEGCPMFGFTDEAKEWCRNDPRKSWRSLLVKTNLEGTIVWYRQDNFWNGEENPDTSASEYVISHGNTIVSVNDESLGIGLQTLS